MPTIHGYFSRFQFARGGFGQLPSWARSIVMLFALPGVAMLLLSIVLVFVSILTLLLLTVPVYRALQAVLGVRPPSGDTPEMQNPFASSPFGALFGFPSSDGPAGRKQVDAKVVDGPNV